MGEKRKFVNHIKWTSYEIEILKDMYEFNKTKDIVKKLPGRTASQIQGKANMLGLKKHVSTESERRENKRISMQKRRELNPDEMRRKQNEWVSANRDRVRQKNREYYHKDFFWARWTKLRGENKASRDQLSELWDSQDGKCALTGVKLHKKAVKNGLANPHISDCHLDHKIPKSIGGTDNIENLQWISAKVNMAKRNMSNEEFIEMCNNVMRLIGERINKQIAE